MKRLLSLLLFAVATTVGAWTVSVGTWVCNPDASIAVPVEIDDAAGLAYAAVRVNYDPQVLVCLGIEKGRLDEAFDGDFLASDDEAGSLAIARFRASDGVAGSGGGVLARIVFAVRPGTARQYSDLAVADVRLGDDSGVRDLALAGDVAPAGGMVRIFSAADSAARLEGAQTVVADTRLASLSLAAGDAIQASDAGTPIVVSGATAAAAPIPVAAPEGGWADGTYVLLKTATAGLSFVAATNTAEALDVTETVEDGIHVYSLAVSVGGIEIVSAEEGEEFGKAAQSYVASFFTGVSKTTRRVVVSGGEENVLLARGLGIRPAISQTNETEAEAAFGAPTLAITEFDPSTGVVRARVTPGDGNTIEGELVKGVVRLRGGNMPGGATNDLASTTFTVNADGYLQAATRGEFRLDADLDLGPAAFFRIAVIPTDE